MPGPLAADQDAVKSAAGAPPNPFVFSLSDMPGSPRASWAEKAAQALPSFLLAVGIIAASHALAGRTDEARRAMLDPRQLDPMLRISNLKEWPLLQRPEDFAILADGLRRAELPE